MVISVSCTDRSQNDSTKIVFLHHSTGGVIWQGDLIQANANAVKQFPRIKAQMPLLFAYYNKEHSTDYIIKELNYPKAEPYGWNNYPFDYYNIWVKNSGEKAFLKEPTLEILTKDYQIIIFKHCFPVSMIQKDTGTPDINSDKMTLENYKLQYIALKDKMHSFPDNIFIVFTGAVQVQAGLSEEEALRAREFHDWVINDWDQADDNVFIWDFYQLQTEGTLYFKNEYAVSENDAHPNKDFAGKTANLLFERIIDIIENNGRNTDLAGTKIK